MCMCAHATYMCMCICTCMFVCVSTRMYAYEYGCASTVLQGFFANCLGSAALSLPPLFRPLSTETQQTWLWPSLCSQSGFRKHSQARYTDAGSNPASSSSPLRKDTVIPQVPGEFPVLLTNIARLSLPDSSSQEAPLGLVIKKQQGERKRRSWHAMPLRRLKFRNQFRVQCCISCSHHSHRIWPPNGSLEPPALQEARWCLP